MIQSSALPPSEPKAPGFTVEAERRSRRGDAFGYKVVADEPPPPNESTPQSRDS